MRKKYINSRDVTSEKHLLLPFFLCIIILTLVFPNSNAFGYADRTYEIDLEVYCSPFAGEDVCGHPVSTPNYCCRSTLSDLEDFFDNNLDDTMYMLNEIYRPTGTSFRIDQVNIHWNDTTYSTISHDTDVDDPDSNDGARVKELKDIAAGKPGKITWFIIGSGGVAGFSAVPPYLPAPPIPTYDSYYYGFFTGFSLDPILVAHELGHHFCLVHPFTFDDPEQADDEGRPVNHDGDGSGGVIWKVYDTADDPGPMEFKHPDFPGWDAYINGGLHYEIDHNWCSWWQHYTDLDPNSPFDRYCTMECYRSISDTAYEIAPYVPDPNLIISYYSAECSGPYVFGNGNRVEAFSPDQLYLIDKCFAEVTERQLYENVCVGLGDSDHDGICDPVDNCKYTPNYSQFDSDGDGRPDPCDNCPHYADPDQTDTDGDGIGDPCDADLDGDGCRNDRDDNAYNNRHRVGMFTYPDCDVLPRPRYGLAGEDTDEDGIPNCYIHEVDDDNDGILDWDDPCPTVKDPDGDPELCIFPALGCPPFEIDQCFGPCGKNFFIQLVSRINPADAIVFQNIAISGDTIYLQSMPGMTLSEAARSLTGEQFTFVGAELAQFQSVSPLGVDGAPLVLELWSRSPEQLVEVLAEFGPDQVSLGEDIAHGRAVAVRVTPDALMVNGTWVLGLNEDDSFADSDGDSVPDFADNCTTVPNPQQKDRDKDGFGDICDPDFDQNGVVTAEEINFIRNCEGVDLTAPKFYGLEKLHGITGKANPFVIDVIRASECLKADLSGDNNIEQDDTAAAANLLGERPGPSGMDGKIPRAANIDIKMGVRDKLEDLHPTGDKKTDHQIEKAIKHIQKSLGDALWKDGSHLTKKGKKVFDEEKKAVHELMKIVKDEGPNVADAQAAIDSLIGVDKNLAQTAIEEAQAACSTIEDDKTQEKCQKEIDKALKEMDKAQKENDKGKYDKAIEHYKKAWDHAQRAMKKDDDDNDDDDDDK